MFLHGYWQRVCVFWAVAAFATTTFVESVNESTLAAQRQPRDQIDYRLPVALEPIHYDLYLHPDLEAGTFSGQETIRIKVKEATKQIILHSDQLILNSVYVEGRELEGYGFDEVRQLLIVDMKEQLQVNTNITLGIVFEGKTVNKLVGLYSSVYTSPNGEQRKISTTKFEPTYARQAFPCFDEPAMKATYNISVTHPNSGSYSALSNMNERDSLDLGEEKVVFFETSLPMSTYLACIIVSDFDSEKATVRANGIGSDFTMRAFATPHQLHKVKFALEFGVAVTEYYIKYFNVEYPLPKLDMAAIPDFVSNAMEHWGLVTYRETALLYDEDYSSTFNKQSIAAVLAHEITHQWFGNLVTMKWWNDLWLNEGFARFMQYKGIHAVHPDWGMPEQFQIDTLQPVLIFDSKLSSHPIVQTVESPDEITALFDTITYDKAGSVLRMLEALVGSEKFEKAVTNYLKEFQYGNTVTDDFLTHVAAQVSDLDVKKFMRTWTEQMGYPVLNVEFNSDSGIIITQKRFLSNKASYDEVAEPTAFGYRWSVPVTYTLDSSETNEVKSVMFEYDQDALGIALGSSFKWVKLNAHQLGFYRVNYESSIWQALIDQLLNEPQRFDIADRAHLLDDSFALAAAGQLSYDVPLDMAAYLAKEREFVPWFVANTNLIVLKKNLMFSDSYISYLSYARSLLTNVYKEVGWNVEKDNHLGNRLRVSVLGAACSLGLTDCLDQAQQLFTKWLKEPTAANRPAPDLREIVYFFGMQQTSSEANWEAMLELYKAETDASEKLKLLYGLSGVQDAQLLYRFLELTKDQSIIRSQDFAIAMQYIASNPVGQPIVWDYYRDQWPVLVNRFGLNDRSFGKIIASITSLFASELKLEEVQEFFKKYPEAGAGTASRQQAIETIKYNINWLKENSKDIATWLDGKASPLTPMNPL